MDGQTEFNDSIRDRLKKLYDARALEAEERIVALLRSRSRSVQQPELASDAGQADAGQANAKQVRWSERDVVLITYGDQIRPDDHQAGNDPVTPLGTLHRWLLEERWDRQINVVHLLPFSPYSSDDGFSVIDYRQVAAEIGTWEDVRRLSGDVDLMFDLVLNHCSSQSEWFAAYCRGEEPYAKFFIECDPAADVSQVTRPRSLPLLTPVETTHGERHVWTTFSSDQIDLNFAEPAVLAEMLDILLDYVERGARIIRLDAIAYLWKQLGTSCIHLPQTHEVVKLIRDILDCVAPHVILLTETNVPHRENVSYFGDGDEAHMVYQFSLPPLILDAFVNADATPLKRWLSLLEPPRAGTTYFNFTSSHDGIGVRPLEGLVDDQRLADLVAAVRRNGGRVNTRRREDGTDAPYELNITYVDALAEGDRTSPQHLRRFIASQAIMLALQGIPGIYFHCLVGSGNDEEGLQQSGQNRRINRHKYSWSELRMATSGETFQRQVMRRYRQLLEVRQHQAAFHPDAEQIPLELDELPQVIGWIRKPDNGRSILVLANVSDTAVEVTAPQWQPPLVVAGCPTDSLIDLLSMADEATESAMNERNEIRLAPYQVRWLRAGS